MNFDFADILLEVIERGRLGPPPHRRLARRWCASSGKLRALDYPTLTAQDTREIVYSILNNDQRKKLENEWQIDLSYSRPRPRPLPRERLLPARLDRRRDAH